MCSRIAILLLTLAIILPTVNLTVSAEQNAIKISVDEITENNATIIINNSGTDIENACLIAAVYDVYGEMCDVSAMTVSVGSGDTESYGILFSKAFSHGYTVRVFLRDNIESMRPLCGMAQSVYDNLPEVTMNDFYHKLDGSTVTVPLSEAMAKQFFGANPMNGAIVRHNRTEPAIRNIVDGERDLALVTYPSADNFAYAKSKGISLVTVPVVNDAFVFLINEDNPVKSLTSQQIKDIYSGKITNWKELGGNDVDIIPLQRTAGGSQSGMIEFMGDTEIMVPFEDSTVVEMMGMLVERVTQEPDAIGYSYYYYTHNMASWHGEPKLLELDGVAPSNSNIENGAYPVIAQYYAVFRADEPAGGFARSVTEYLLSQYGQKAAEGIGYVKLGAEQVKPLPDPEPGYVPKPPPPHPFAIEEYGRFLADDDAKDFFRGMISRDYGSDVADGALAWATGGVYENIIKTFIYLQNYGTDKEIAFTERFWLDGEVYGYAGEVGIEIEVTPVFYNPLVFIVDRNNPVDNLTTQQLKDIYSGDAVGWGEVGGYHGDISLYSSETSHTYDYVGYPSRDYSVNLCLFGFLGVDEINLPMPARWNRDWFIGEDEDTMAYDPFALGYSFNSKDTGHYKVLTVDGFAPGDGGYPVKAEYVAVTGKPLAADSFADRLLRYILSPEGQEMAESLGYIKIN